MLAIERKTFIFKNKEIWFAENPYDVKGYDSINFMECKNKVDLEGFMCSDFSTLVIDLTQDLDTILKNMKPKGRQKINRAYRDNIKVRINEKHNEFYEINESFRKKKGLAKMVLTPEFMKSYGTLFTAELNNKVVAGAFFLGDENNIRDYVSSSIRLDKTVEKSQVVGNANGLLIWESIKYAKEKGIKEFDFGGYYTGGDENDPRIAINSFKAMFSGQLVTRYNYEKIYSRKCKWARSLYKLATHQKTT